METTWCPARRLGFGRSVPVAKCEGRAIAMRCVAPEACVATSQPHPMAARSHSFAERQIIPGPRAPKTCLLYTSDAADE